MKRSEIIGKLISEHGFTERTLVNMPDSQITMLGIRILGEQIGTTNKPGVPAVNIPKTNKPAIDQAMRNKETFLTYEGDVSEENEKKKTKRGNGLSPLMNASMFGHGDKNKKKVVSKKDTKECDVKEEKPKNNLPSKKKREVVTKLKENENVKSWIAGLVENEYHPLTSKGEIVELVKQRINEVETMQPMPAHKPKKGHNGIPEWLSYKSIKGAAEPTTKPVTKPGQPVTKPGERPKPNNPFQPGPGKNPRPKASAEPTTKPVTKPGKPVTKPGERPKPNNPFQPGPGKNPRPKARHKELAESEPCPCADKNKINANIIKTKPVKKSLAEKNIKK